MIFADLKGGTYDLWRCTRRSFTLQRKDFLLEMKKRGRSGSGRLGENQ